MPRFGSERLTAAAYMEENDAQKGAVMEKT